MTQWKLGDETVCVVCNKTTDSYCFHSRLGVAICFQCPLTDVQGEDVSTHTMYYVGTGMRFI